MSNIVKLKISIWKRIRIWWNNYGKRIEKRIDYLQEKLKDE